MSGIFAQLPDIAPLNSVRDTAQSGFQGAIGSLPAGAEDILGSLPANLTALANNVPSDAAGPVQPFTTLLQDIRSAISVDLAQPVTTITDGLGQTHSTLLNSTLGKVVFADGETRELKDILLEQLPDLSAQYLAQLTAVRDGMLAQERIQTLIDFVNALSTFSANAPTEPGQLVDFLAQGFVGVPDSLLQGPSTLAAPLIDQLDGMAAAVANADVDLQLGTLTGQFNGATELVGALDLNSAADYQAAIDLLTTTQTTLASLANGLQGVFDGVNTRLDQIDLSQFEVDFDAALANIPAVDVANLDDVRSMLLEPLQQINQLVADPQAFSQRLQVLLDNLSVGLQESDIGAWQNAILGFFAEIRGFVEQLNLVAVRTQIEGAFDTIDQHIADLGGDVRQTVLDTLNPILDAAENGIDSIDLSEIDTFIQNVFGQLNTALDQISVTDLQTEFDTAFTSLESVIADLTTQTTHIADQIDQMIADLGNIQFDPVTRQVVAQIEQTTQKLRQIDPDSLNALQQTALAAAVGILQALDFEQDIINLLSQRCTEVVALPQQPLLLAAERVDQLLDAVQAFDAEVIVAPLNDAYARLTAPVNEMQAATLLQPLHDALAQVKQNFDALSPEQLRAPLDALYTPLPAALDALSPQDLLQPVVEVFDQFEQALNKVDMTELFAQLQQVQNDLFSQAKAQLVGHIQGLGLPSELTNLLVTLTPVLDLMSPAMFTDPVNKFVQVLDKILEELSPGDLLTPLQQLYDQLVALLNQVPDELLAGEFEQVRLALVTGLDQIDPAHLAGKINDYAAETAVFLGPMEPDSIVASLNAPYAALSAVLDNLDAASVPAELQPLHDQLAALVNNVNPDPAITALQGNFTAVQGRLGGIGTVSLDGMMDSYASLHQQVDALIPEFLRAPVTTETLQAALDSARPDALAADINQAFTELKTNYAALRPQLIEALQGFANENQELLLVLDLQGLASQFQETYDAIKAQVLALNPNVIIAELQGTFDTVKAQVEALNPTFLVDELTDTFNRVKGKLDDFGLDAIETGLDSSLQNIKDKLVGLDPQQILGQTGLFERFAQLQEAIGSMSFVAIVQALGEALQKLCNELKEELDKVHASFDTMIAAVPARINLGVSL